MRGVLWSHLLASVCGGLLVVGILLALGDVGKQRTETVPINLSAAPPATSGAGGESLDTETLFVENEPGVVLVRAQVGERTTSPFLAASEPAGSVATGSGFLIGAHAGKGYILTTFHVIEGARRNYSRGIVVQFNPQLSLPAEVVGYDQTDDIALLEVDIKGISSQIHPLSPGNSKSVNQGDSTLSISNPFGGSARTLSSGIVSALQMSIPGVGVSLTDVIQTDNALLPRGAGGPLLDVSGSVIGINDAVKVANAGSESLMPFAIPIDVARDRLYPKGLLSSGS